MDNSFHRWVIKDLCWTQSWYLAGHIFASLTVLWSFYILVKAYYLQNMYEVTVTTAQLLWLLANFWWMAAELHHYQYPNAPKQYETHQAQAGHTMEVALCLLCIYYFVIKRCDQSTL